MPESCRRCHTSALTREHFRRPTDSETKYTCVTCHLSADPVVQGAIAAKDTACPTCHDMSTTHFELHGGGFQPSDVCGRSGCHDANLATEHVTNRAIACEACHESTDATVQLAISTGTTACGACHAGSSGPHLSLHVPHDGPTGACVSCHRTAVGGQDGSTACSSCHVDWFDDDPALLAGVGKGPHGLYSSSSDRCDTCHTIHDAPDGTKLLPAQTVTASCYVCHDGTGGSGVYGVLASRGVALGATHRIDTATVVPGGDPESGAETTMAFAGGINGTLGCSDCHSPHDSNTVAAWTDQRPRTANDRRREQGVTRSNRLLRRNPAGSSATATVYGSDWCLACHAGRGSGGTAHNHPVDSMISTATPFYYENVARLDTDTATTGVTVAGTLAKSNAGFLMPYPRTAEQGGHWPICQQCHENSRNFATGGVGSLETTGDVARAAPFSITATDSLVSTDNPQFQNFPHEAVNRRMLVETDDDLCTNCHPPSQLP